MFKKIKNWEQWPFKVLYAPIAPVWLWYILRSRAVWFFTPSNPRLTFGGMEGEPKKEMHDLLPENTRAIYVNASPTEEFSTIEEQIASHSIRFPLIVKPEVGGQGILFRKLDTISQLARYHEHVPVEYIIQEMVTYPLEVSLFYYRRPKELKGTISGFLHKVPLQVTGDGAHTLQQLMLQHKKAKDRLSELSLIHADNFDKIIPAGAHYPLSYAANHNRGASFNDLKNLIDSKLTAMLDEISHKTDFYYGRYDIMCQSIEDLKKGVNFKILEYNGCGAEPNHFYDNGYTLMQAWREILRHWKMLYRISREKYTDGIAYWPFMKGVRFLLATRKHYEIIRFADKNIP